MNDKEAKFCFRGISVIVFNKETKDLTIGNDANMCQFLPIDFVHMSKFLMDCYLYINNQIEDVKDVRLF